MQVQINRGYNPIICEANSVKTVSDYTLLAFLLLSECAINNYPAELRNAGVSSQWSGNFWLLRVSRTSPLSLLIIVIINSWMRNCQMSLMRREGRWPPVTLSSPSFPHCQHPGLGVINITPMPLISIIISFSPNATSVGVVFKGLIQVWLEDIRMHQLHLYCKTVCYTFHLKCELFLF